MEITLLDPVSAGDAWLHVSGPTPPPRPPFLAAVFDPANLAAQPETIEVVASGGEFWEVRRGRNGTAATAWPAGSYLRPMYPELVGRP